MDDKQIEIAEQMQIKLAQKEAARTPKPPFKQQTPVESVGLNELRSRQQRMIAQQLLNIVDDQDVIRRVHKSLLVAYVKQMGLTKQVVK